MPIVIDRLEHIYEKNSPTAFTALQDITLTIPDNEFVGVIGHTGSGKSTLIQHFNGLLLPTGGKITVNDIVVGENKAELKKLRRTVGMVFQYPEHQLFEETVYKDIAFGPTKLGLADDEIEERVIEAMEHVGLDRSLENRSPFELSGGQKRRAAIAGVLAMRPQILVLDEPVAGLDPKGREEMLELISKYRAVYRATIIMISHNMDDIARVSTRVAVMNKGRLIQYGTPAQVFSNVEQLSKIGLGVPEAANISIQLQKRGINIPFCLTIHELAQNIKRLREAKC